MQHPAERRRLIAILMADVVGYGRLMSEAGAAALRSLAESRGLMEGIVATWRGRVVGTQGDAFLAEFPSCADSVKAALDMQARIVGHELVLKLGIHAGASVVVNLNDRLDYFGSTVNMAARLQGQSEGGDIVLSRAVAADPAVRELIAAVPSGEESVALKGFADPISFVRLRPS